MIARRFAGALLAGALALSACGGETQPAGKAGESIESIEPSFLPPELLGLRIAKEDMTEVLTDVDRSYLDGLGLFSMRRGDLLEATLQVSRFGDDARYGDADFQARMIQQIGNAKAREAKVGDFVVHLTRGTKQQISVWFDERFMFVLAVRDDFEQPRALLRSLLGTKP
ncbi:MAG TPA: hypothetical protein VM938_12440 [Acidimicrobiales bacterium]|nr:hypothetical protein [Acidimicrobiales bacterium]